MWTNMIEIMKQYPAPPLEFPLIMINKSDILRQASDRVLETFWTCEMPKGNKACLQCHTCRGLLEAVVALPESKYRHVRKILTKRKMIDTSRLKPLPKETGRRTSAAKKFIPEIIG